MLRRIGYASFVVANKLRIVKGKTKKWIERFRGGKDFLLVGISVLVKSEKGVSLEKRNNRMVLKLELVDIIKLEDNLEYGVTALAINF